MIGLIIIGVLFVLLVAAIATNFKKDHTIVKDSNKEVDKSVLSTEGSEKLSKQESSATTNEKKD